MKVNKKRRMEIMIETHKVTVVRISENSSPVHCEICRKSVAVLTVSQVAELVGLSMVEISQRLETGDLHSVRENRETALICGKSLEKKVN